MIWALTACGPAAPTSWEGLEQAVVLGPDAIVVDRVRAREGEGGTVVRAVDRCRWDGGREVGCTLAPEGRSVLSRRGGLLLDEVVAPDHRRVLHVLDPVTLSPTASMPLGLEPDGRVPGGALFVQDGAVLVFANHGLSGVDVPDGSGRATFTVESWRDGALSWRRGLRRWPQEADVAPGVLAVLDLGEWRLYDVGTGAVRVAPAAGGAGGCLTAAALDYVSTDEPPARVHVPVDGSPPTLTAGPEVRPGACVVRGGEPWFHGGDGEGGGFLLEPDGRVVPVPRVDLELGDHEDGDGALWLVELGRGMVVWDPVMRAARGPSRELHDVIRAGDDLLAYGVGVDLELWIGTRAGEWRRPHRLSPRSWHVAGDRLWTFAHRATEGEPLIEVLELPSLRVVGRVDDWPAR